MNTTLPAAKNAHVQLALIAAVARNRVIGAEGDLPWRLKADLLHFKAVTSGKPVIMGRNTWESLPRRPLPARSNLVVTRSPDYIAPGAWVYSSLAVAVGVGRAMAARAGADEAMIIGGGAIYEAALPMAHILYLTEVDAEPEGDVLFPEIDAAVWRQEYEKVQPADADNQHAFVMRKLVRI